MGCVGTGFLWTATTQKAATSLIDAFCYATEHYFAEQSNAFLNLYREQMQPVRMDLSPFVKRFEEL